MIWDTVETEMGRIEMWKIAYSGGWEACYTIFTPAELLYLFKFCYQLRVWKPIQIFLIQLE